MKNLNALGSILEDEIRAKLAEASDDDIDEAVVRLMNNINEEIEDLDESDVEVEDLFYVLRESQLVYADGKVDLEEGYYVSVDDYADDGFVIVSVFNADGDVVIENISVAEDAIGDLVDNEFLDFAEYDEVEEGIHIRGGKKVKISNKMEKLKKKLAAKKTGSVNKFTLKDGKIVKKSAEQIKNDKKKAKTFGKKMKKFKAKRNKSMKKAAKIKDGANSGTVRVKEGFDMSINGMKLALEEGDILSVAEGKVTVTRGNKNIVSDAVCDESFITRCIDEGVADKEETVNEYAVDDCITYKGSYYLVKDVKGTSITLRNKETDEEITVDADEISDDEGFEEGCGKKKPNECARKNKTDEGAVLTYKAGEGYIITESGKERTMGNRARTRAMLVAEGYDISADKLNKAVEGKTVIL